MIYQVLSVFDRALNAYARPIYTASVGVATRSFTDEVNRSAEDNPMYKHPDDYELFLLGVWDDSDGSFDGEVRPKLIVRAKDVARGGSNVS